MRLFFFESANKWFINFPCATKTNNIELGPLDVQALRHSQYFISHSDWAIFIQSKHIKICLKKTLWLLFAYSSAVVLIDFQENCLKFFQKKYFRLFILKILNKKKQRLIKTFENFLFKTNWKVCISKLAHFIWWKNDSLKMFRA